MTIYKILPLYNGIFNYLIDDVILSHQNFQKQFIYDSMSSKLGGPGLEIGKL